MIRLSATPLELHFKYPFKIAHGTRSTTPIVLLNMYFDNYVAYGEASMPPYLGESHTSVLDFIKKATSFISGLKNLHNINEILAEVDEIEKGNTAAKAAIDIALHDLIGKLNKAPTWQMLGCKKVETPYTTHTIGIADELILKSKIAEARDFKILKIKLNGVDDKKLISTIRKYTNKAIVVDVNQGWKTVDEALRIIDWLMEQNVVLVEQPLPKENWKDANRLNEKSPLPIYADESIQRLNDIEKAKECFTGINIKLMKCTGINEASKMIALARSYNLKVLIGCMSETSCAVSAAAQLSPLADYADLDGPLLITNDFFYGITYEDGKICLNDEPGFGLKERES